MNRPIFKRLSPDDFPDPPERLIDVKTGRIYEGDMAEQLEQAKIDKQARLDAEAIEAAHENARRFMGDYADGASRVIAERIMRDPYASAKKREWARKILWL